MISHYLRSTWRTIRRNPLYSFISIGCLAIGIAVSLTILLYVLHEHSYDKWQARSERIYSVMARLKFGDAQFNVERMSFSTGPLVQQADGDVESYFRLYTDWNPVTVRDPVNREVFYTEKGKMAYADSNFFSFFSYRLMRGDPRHVLDRPFTLVLSERMAKKYFGNADAMGRTLHIGDDDFQVTGIAANPPSNTEIGYELIGSISNVMAMAAGPGKVQGGAFKTWFLLKKGANVGRIERTMQQLSIVPGQAAADRDVYTLTPLAQYHLGVNFGDASNIRYLRIFPVVAALILLLALINYISLSTARAAARAKEVGVRKVLGAGRERIAGQFYIESTVFAVLSFGLGILLFILFRPYFLNLLHLAIDTGFLLSARVLACFGGLLVLVILLAGSYPSLVLSAFRPVAVLYGKLSRQRSGELVRKGFIVFQFTISMSLVLCSLIIGKQLYYLRHTDTGMDRENVLMVPFKQLSHYAAFKQEVAGIPGVRMVGSSLLPLFSGTDGWAVQGPRSDKAVQLMHLSVDSNYITMLGLKWVEKPADAALLTDGKHIVLNQAAVAKLGLAGDAVGQRVKFGNEELAVGGVLKDYVYGPMQGAIDPLSLTVRTDTMSAWGDVRGGCLLVKIGAHVNIPSTIDAVREVYRRYDRRSAFEYSFADEAFDNQYKAEDRLAGIFGVFTVITVMIACLGLFALATFSAQQRVREIGIRKVLGASVASIGSLLSRDFLRPVLLAVLIACPLSWWMMHRWLEDFAYRTSLSWWIFAGAGLGLLLVALATVLVRSLRAGRANPVDNLRSE